MRGVLPNIKDDTPFDCFCGITGALLTVMPLARSGNVLSATEFRDGLALRCALPLQRMPES
jgi:hypothetical protein